MNHSEIVSFIWNVADLIRDSLKRGYEHVILTRTVLFHPRPPSHKRVSAPFGRVEVALEVFGT